MKLEDLAKWATLLQRLTQVMQITAQATGDNESDALKVAGKLGELSGDVAGYIRSGEAFDEAFADRVAGIADRFEANDNAPTSEDFFTIAGEIEDSAAEFRATMANRRAAG